MMTKARIAAIWPAILVAFAACAGCSGRERMPRAQRDDASRGASQSARAPADAAKPAAPPVPAPNRPILPSPWQPPAVIDPIPPEAEGQTPGQR